MAMYSIASTSLVIPVLARKYLYFQEVNHNQHRERFGDLDYAYKVLFYV